MFDHKSISYACLPHASGANQIAPLLAYFAQTPMVRREQITDNVDVVVAHGARTPAERDTLANFVKQGGTLLYLHDFTQGMSGLPDWFGARPMDPIVPCEVRVLPTDAQNPICTRLGDAFYFNGMFQPIEVTDENTETVFYADWRYTHQAMLTARPLGNGQAMLTTMHDWSNKTFQRLIYRILRTAVYPESHEKTLGVGLLGYAPSVGQLHGSGAAVTDGLSLTAACDLSPARLDVARKQFPDIATTNNMNELIDNPDIDIVIIATPPNSHAKLAMQLLEGGKNVICEKPLALNRAEADGMINLAAKNGLHVSCHQNRRWDSDFLAIQNAVDAGWLGDVFYLETFIGGYGHPCGYWHSHDAVSGGTTFDWGAHYLDWMLALIPSQITGVMGTRQNRAWHDITNADHERIFLRYANGAEAEFTHSDLTFIPKPKWFMAGSEGTLIGQWRTVEAYEIDPVVYYHRHEIPPAELGADIELRRRTDAGIFTQQLPHILPNPFPFHSNLADYLLLGEPLTVPVDHSARVVSILEAAKRSVEEDNGRLQDVEI